MFAIHLLNSHSAISDHEIRSWNLILPDWTCNFQESLSIVECVRILSLSNGWLHDKFIWGAIHFDRKMPAEFWSKRTRSHRQNPFPPTIGCFKVDGGNISSTHWNKIHGTRRYSFGKWANHLQTSNFLSSKHVFFQWCCYSPKDSGWEKHGITPKEMMVF